MIKKIAYNSPVVLTFTFISLIVLISTKLFGTKIINTFFSVYYTSFADPFQYIRLFTHVLGHSSVDHWFGNITFILLLGPMIEEKYSSRQFLLMVFITAVVTGLLNVIFFNVILLGASGIVFMLILLSSFSNIKKGRIPLTFILVALIFIGREVFDGIFGNDNVSQFSHIVGGVCGFIFARKT